MSLIQSVILGIVEGVTEFLPISSTGHLVLTSNLLNIPQTDFVKSFEIAIQLGAILSVAVLYWKKVLTSWEIIKRIIVAFTPTAILGTIFYKIIKGVLLSNDTVIVYSLFIGGIIIILFELLYNRELIQSVCHPRPPRRVNSDGDPGVQDSRHLDSHLHGNDRIAKLRNSRILNLTKNVSIDKIEKISLPKAALIGVFQSIAMIPGVSRSAATIIGGSALGIDRKTIVEFSFLLAAPTMFAATTLDLLKSGASFTSEQFGLLFVGFFVSFIVAILAIKFLLGFIKNHTFVWFGVYRIALAIVFILFVLR